MSNWPAYATGNINVTQTNHYGPKVASDGSKNIMIVSCYDYNATDKDVISYSSTNGVFGPFTANGIGTSTFVEQYPEIAGKYYSNGSFYCSMLKGNANNHSMIYRTSSHNVWNNSYELQNDSLQNYHVYDTRPGFRFVNGDSCFAVFCSSQKLCASTGCNTGGSYAFLKNLHLKFFIEGLYNQNINGLNTKDTVKVYLQNALSPYNRLDSAKNIVNINGNGDFNFANALNNKNYYIVVKGRNILETWSKINGEVFVNNELSYDLAVSNSQAYGYNEKQIDPIPVTYGIYSGDVDQDGIIDASDLSIIDNNAFNFVSGYVPSDLNGNNFVDGSDYLIADNNAFNFIFIHRP
jgi:hypothetical protein